MTARASGSKSASRWTPSIPRSTRPSDGGRRSTDDVQVREAREHRLAADRSVLEGDRHFLVAPRELAGHHDPVAPPGVTDSIAVAEAALARDDRPVGADAGR